MKPITSPQNEAQITEIIAQFDERRKKLYFRSNHRGIKEMDIIFTQFALRVLPEISEAELDDYERILELPDTDLFAWATGRQSVPTDISSPLLDKLLSLSYME